MDKSILKSLLEKVPDSYPDFVHGVLLCTVNEKILSGLIDYMEKHPEADSSSVSERLCVLEGRE